MVLSRVIAKRWKLLGDWTFGSLRRLSRGSRARVTSWKESGLPTATSSREAHSFSHRGSINARLSRQQLGCEFCEDSNCIQCGENAATNIPGVYAAGNASRGVQLVIAAAAEGMQAAFAINSALLDADAASNALRDHEPGQPTPSDRITPGNEAVD